MKKAIYLGKSTRTPPSMCLNCGAALDAATGVGHRNKPRAGAICICFKCGHLQAMGSDLQFRELTDEEMVDIAGDERIVKMQEAIAFAKAVYNLKKKYES